MKNAALYISRKSGKYKLIEITPRAPKCCNTIHVTQDNSYTQSEHNQGAPLEVTPEADLCD